MGSSTWTLLKEGGEGEEKEDGKMGNSFLQ